jgi:hypothetical protein
MVDYRRIEFAKGGWRSRVAGVFAIVIGLALVVGIIVLSLSIALVLLPLVVIAVLIGRWRWRKLVAQAEADLRSTRRGGGPVIDLDYDVVDNQNDDGPEAHRR